MVASCCISVGEEVGCEKVKSGLVCEPLAGFRPLPDVQSFDVYIDTLQGKTQAKVDMQLRDALSYLSGHTDKFDEVPEECVVLAVNIMCYMSLSFCVRNGTSGAIDERPVCREYCEDYKKKKDCQKIVEELQHSFTDARHSNLDLSFLSWPVNCGVLPSKNGGSFPECVDDPKKNWNGGE